LCNFPAPAHTFCELHHAAEADHHRRCRGRRGVGCGTPSPTVSGRPPLVHPPTPPHSSLLTRSRGGPLAAETRPAPRLDACKGAAVGRAPLAKASPHTCPSSPPLLTPLPSSSDETADITLFERGEYVSFANCGLPYHIDGTIPSRASLLVQTVQGLTARFAITIRTRHEVVAIHRADKTVTVRDLAAGTTATHPYDLLLLAPGARPIVPPSLPGLAEALSSGLVHTLRSMNDMDGIKARCEVVEAGGAAAAAPSAPPRKPAAVVVGGGFIGLEMAEALAGRGMDVTIVEFGRQVLPTLDFELAQVLHAHIQERGVHLRLGTSATAFAAAPAAPADAASTPALPGGGGSIAISLSDGTTVSADVCVLAIGVAPESSLAKDAGLELGARGAIVVNDHMQTSDPAIFAVGDAVLTRDPVLGGPTWVPLGGPANRQARVAADCMALGVEASGRSGTYRGTLGTSVVKVFGLTAASTGASQAALERAKVPHHVVHVHPASHAGYYPGAQPIALKLCFAPGTGKVLGAQAVGADGVDKRIDVLATALHAGLSVRDLCELELCYAPPYGSAKDVVNFAGFAATNILDDLVSVLTVPDLASLTLLPPAEAAAEGAPANAAVFVDVREPSELKGGSVPGSVNIPLPQLRARIGELSAAKAGRVVVSCAVGLRGYMASRILRANGFERVSSLSGGWKTYAAFKWGGGSG
jgi:NADPH-dependent 2,4-dienoyl-CoA reductase/sulfur reductase-like enzyme/rhodanese-related sulfurtransferase